MPTPAEIVAIYGPQYSDDPRLPAALSVAGGQLAPDHCYHSEAVALLALHMLAIADRGGSGGAVASETEGGLSRSFRDAGGPTGSLGATSFGTELARLNKLCYGLTARTAWGELYGQF